MPSSTDPNPHVFPRVLEISERLNEQHRIITETLGFLLHPKIPLSSSTKLKFADIATGTGIFLLDLSKRLPSNYTFTGFDVSSSTFPLQLERPSNVTFKLHDMLLPFPDEEVGAYDVVTIRFVSAATSRAEWQGTVKNLLTLLKPGGWLQWIDSCNYNLYNSVAGISRQANMEIYDALQAFKNKDDLVIGMMIREPRRLFREDVFEELDMTNVHEDVFSSDRVGRETIIRETATKNMIGCFRQYLEALTKIEGSGWTQDRVEKVCERAMMEVDQGVYCTLDQVCIIGRKT